MRCAAARPASALSLPISSRYGIRWPRGRGSPESTAITGCLGFTGIDALHMLVWSAVLNGIVAVPIMAMMMVIVANEKLMGRFKAKSWLIWLGWIGTAVMALAVVALLGSFIAGLS